MLIDIDDIPEDPLPQWRVTDVTRGPACMRLDGLGRLLSENRQDTNRYPGMRLLTANLEGVDDFGVPKFDAEKLQGDRSRLTKGSRGIVAFALPGAGIYEYWNFGEAFVRGFIACGDDGRIASISALQARKMLERLAQEAPERHLEAKENE